MLVIRNSPGQMVFEDRGDWQGGSRVQIVTPELPAAVYTVELWSGTNTWLEKLVIGYH